MSPRTFQGQTMAQALAEVKRHFGADAVILSTRTVSGGGLLGLKSRPLVEITAARESPALAEAGRTRRLALQARQERASPSSAGHVSAVPVGQREMPAGSSACLLKEVGSLKSMIADLMVQSQRSNIRKAPKALHELYRVLVENAVAEDIATSLISELEEALPGEELRNKERVREQLALRLAQSLPVAGPISTPPSNGPYIVALIGPTGVGKTTTIAKLAANFSLKDQKKVGLITLDTYRIAAVEQLKTYAQIITVPLQVAMSPQEFQDAAAGMADREIILIDSAGRSQRDAMKINELREFFDAVTPHETHLVLSSAASERVIHQAIDRFSPVGFDRIIFTKMDEAVGFGVILGALKKVDARLSYVTAGQDVPSDIEVCEPGSLARKIMGE